MTVLMAYAGPSDTSALVTRVGGLPLVPAGFTWPVCAECSGPMQFLVQMLSPDPSPERAPATPGPTDVLLIFMCQNDPGLCEEWDPRAGGNRALLLTRDDLRPAVSPDEGETLLPESFEISLLSSERAEREGALDQVVGQLGGTPEWLQHDETPSCPSCSKQMEFVAQFEQCQDASGRELMNFGGGLAYTFACERCREASFLWQC